MCKRKKKKKKYNAFFTSLGRDDQTATCAKLLDITHESYGFSGNLTETID